MESTYEKTSFGSESEESARRDAEERLKEDARTLKEETMQKGKEYIEHRKDSAAEIVGDFAEALQTAAGELENRNRSVSAEYIRTASHGVRQLSDSLRGHKVDGMVEQVKIFARRQPELLFGGAVITGFALTRLFKSSGSVPAQRPYENHPILHIRENIRAVLCTRLFPEGRCSSGTWLCGL
ncbi:MAG: hypothetical protein SCH71_07010 [Desulfobulbaceae bacterium]|nr:hypothetical protein [Desulfobulbaceae bacterium]